MGKLNAGMWTATRARKPSLNDMGSATELHDQARAVTERNSATSARLGAIIVLTKATMLPIQQMPTYRPEQAQAQELRL